MISLLKQAKAAKAAALIYQEQSAKVRQDLLLALASALEADVENILLVNAAEVKEQAAAGLDPVLQDRLRLTPERMSDLVSGVRQIATLPDLLGQELESRRLENGLRLKKIRVPLGVVGMIYEARPNVTVDAAALCLKTGNAALLRGSRLARRTNHYLVQIIGRVLRGQQLPPQLVQLVADDSHDSVLKMARLRGYLDVIIPRGGARLIQTVLENATVPVLETGVGNCHLFIDQSADPQMAIAIAINGKCSRPSVCNALETVLIHRQWPKEYVLQLLTALHEAGVTLHIDKTLLDLAPAAVPATEEDWDHEYLTLELAVKQAADVDEAIAHINRHGTRHSESIVTADSEHAARFLQQVDAACVYHNVSTRFSDGFALGLGAEIGISTQKLHARGPMGQEALTSYKYVISGEGQVR
ncbi:MAG: glutamate-5-semialdehyde dehydrogenase [Bacillota bacterium]|jgi:glutamate-5-semialdehyde dehydrogenase